MVGPVRKKISVGVDYKFSNGFATEPGRSLLVGVDPRLGPNRERRGGEEWNGGEMVGVGLGVVT